MIHTWGYPRQELPENFFRKLMLLKVKNCVLLNSVREFTEIEPSIICLHNQLIFIHSIVTC